MDSLNLRVLRSINKISDVDMKVGEAVALTVGIHIEFTTLLFDVLTELEQNHGYVDLWSRAKGLDLGL